MITLSEQVASYELFYRSMMDIDDELAKLEFSVEAEGSEPSEWTTIKQGIRDLPILSGVRAGLVVFAKSHGMTHYLCFRHILKSLGMKT
jgi:hypothetical protein